MVGYVCALASACVQTTHVHFFTSTFRALEGFEGSEIRRRQEVFAASRSYFEIMFDAVTQIESKVSTRVLTYGASVLNSNIVDHISFTSTGA